MSEFRKDPLSDRWVLTLDDPFFTPDPSYNLNKENNSFDENCPFCPGNENRSSHEIMRIVPAANSEKWSIRVVANNNPYVKVETQLKKRGENIFDIVSGTGANEVVIESVLHNDDLDTMSFENIFDLVKVWRSRINDLLKDKRFEFIMIFRNKGERAGATVVHPHSQVMGLPVIPGNIASEIESARKYYSFKQRCSYCDVIDAEMQSGIRTVSVNGYYVCFVPFASRSPFEMMILPKNHIPHFHWMDDAAASDFAAILKDSIRRINIALNKPSYSIMIHTSPVQIMDVPHYHWHAEILPRIKPIAGFEWASGFHINPTLPEDAADYLRRL